MKKRLTFLVALLIAAATSFAAPVMPGFKKTLPTANGNVITAELQGDEFLSWWETADGKRYTLSDDGKCFVDANFDTLQHKARIMRAPLVKGGIGGDHITYTGTKKGLIILVEFADKKFDKAHDHAYYDAIANQSGFTNDEGYIGSVHDYYNAQSNGQFDLTFDVIGPVCVSKGYAYYGANTSSTKDVKMGEMLKEASDMAAPKVNLADYDWDGDGIADQVFYLYAGLGENASDDPNTIWAHMYYMRNRGGKLTYSTGSIDRYACASELLGVLNKDGYTGDTRASGIGTICHEFSHCLGFPDTYDTNGQKQYGMGYYDLLSNGNYLGEGFTPPNFTAWERIYAGWVEPIVLDKAATIKSMQSSTDYGRPFIMYNDSNHDEYYLFENRQKTGWDCKLFGEGLMITHVDYLKSRWTSNNVNTTGKDHQRMTIFHADNEATNNVVSKIRGDLYPYVNTKTGSVINNKLTDTSAPAAMLWNSNDSKKGTSFMGKPITEITRNDDGTVSFLVKGGDDNNIVDNRNLTGIVSLRTIDNKTADSRVFSIDGTLLGTDINDMPHGLYIVGGRKVVK